MPFVVVGSSLRQQVQCTLARRYKTVEEAEIGLGVTIDTYQGDDAAAL